MVGNGGSKNRGMLANIDLKSVRSPMAHRLDNVQRYASGRQGCGAACSEGVTADVVRKKMVKTVNEPAACGDEDRSWGNDEK